ncbi:hypothetical protein MtrunA17_Chr1g0171651 [Medicago truncatula]|uniref:Transmembrane protein n=1 Tax=Medicago truncatula TaxID=3880 RepID=A0A396JW82_MEDTR|nr:hypothetical protein MtrunA17_Chr1g0171651 [Medicago truncatula]
MILGLCFLIWRRAPEELATSFPLLFEAIALTLLLIWCGVGDGLVLGLFWWKRSWVVEIWRFEVLWLWRF